MFLDQIDTSGPYIATLKLQANLKLHLCCFETKGIRNMRILLCGVAAVALSGCSWMGFGHGNDHGYAPTSQSSYAKSNDNCCVGGQTLSRWNVEGGVGADFVVGGDAITGDQVHANSFPVTNVNNVSMSEAYDTGYRAELGGSYAVNPNRKITVQGFYTQANGTEVDWATQGANTLRGTMTDYEAYGVEAGVRQYFQPTSMPLVKSVRPYVEGKLGAAHLNDSSLVGITATGVADPRNPTSLAMYEGGWVPTAAGLVGVETPLFNRFTVGVETGVRFIGTPQSDNTDFNAVAPNFNRRYAGANNGGSRLSVPVTIRGRYRF